MDSVNESEVFQMEANEDLLREAKLMINSDAELPAAIKGFTNIFVALGDDESINAMVAFMHRGISYRIGTRK